MDTRNLYTNLPEQINRQIEQKTQVNDVNTQSVATTMQDGIEPLYLSQLNNSFDSNIPPAMPQIQWVTYFEDGKPVVEMTIIFSGKDKLGHDVKGQVIADIYRDKDNSGTFEDDEHIDSIDLQQTNKFVDRGAPVDETVRYKILLKNMGNRQQTWSDPIIVSTSDNVTPYTPPVGVDPDTLLDEIVVLTDNLNSVTNGDNCNAVLKIKKHDDEEFRLFEINVRVVGTTNWEKQSDVLSDTALVSGYYYIGLKNLIRGTFYEVRVRAQRKSGKASDWSTSIQFIAGDYIGPQKPENVYAVNTSTDVALSMHVNWSYPLREGNNGLKGFKVYRWEYNNTTAQFIDGSKALITTVDATATPDKETFAYIDTTVVDGNYYAYEVYAYDNSAAENQSMSAWTYPELATYISDSSLITLDYVNDDNTFPLTVDWTPYAGGYSGTYLAFRELDGDKRILFQKDFKNATKSYTITLQDFKEVDAKDFLTINAWQSTHNYSVEVGEVYNSTYAGVRRRRAGLETLLINPKPEDVSGFVATYDAIRHQMDFKWTKNTDAILTGYEIRSISEANWNALQAITGSTPTDIAARKAIWDLGTAIATAKVLNKDASDWTYQIPTAVTPSPTDPIAYYFLIRAVGDFFVDYQYRSADFSKIIYSQESGESTTSVLQKLPAPVVDTVAYTSAQLDGKVMRVNWTIALTADQKRQFKEFWLYMSTTATDVDDFDSTYRVWRGADLTTVLEKDHLRATLNYATTYYFRVAAVDHYDYPGNLSERFTNYPAGTLRVLPRAKITGTDFIRNIPIELNSRSKTPLNADQTVSVFKSRSMQFEITAAFTKDRYVDRIRWYVSSNDGPYILATETFFDKEKVNAEVLIPIGFKQSYAFATDQVLFQVKAVQYRPDGTEGSVPSAPESNYAKIDTMVPNLDIQKIWYKSDNSIAINKNGYINKKILANGIDIYYRAYEKDSNSGINRVEYNYNNGTTWTTATGSPINITNAMLGADTVDGVYKEFEIKIRALDNADNEIEQVIRFKKDTVGPATSDLPTSLTWAFGRNIMLSWVNPAKTNRNLYDGLKLYVGATLATAKEYSLDSNPFSWKPASSPVQLFLAATDIADNLTYLDYNGAVQANQDNPTVIEITNVKPAPPANVRLNALVGGCEAFWDAVTTDVSVPPRAEEVEKYWIQYAIAETEPAVGSGDWLFPTNYETFSPKINLSLSATQMDLFAANTSLKLWVRVDASDYWGLRSDPSTAAFVVPKNITAVDMGNNIFKFKLSNNAGITLLPYVGAVQTGSTEHILDANYIDNEFVRFTLASTTNDYIKIDLNKVEWISDIKLKFKHPTSNIRFVFKLEEVTSTGTQDVWLQSVSNADHTFNNAGDIVTSATKPAADRYFEYSTTGSGVGDMALFHYENFSTGKAILAKSISIYFYSPDSTVVNLVEFQPVIMSIANIFYGSEVNLDYLLSIRSKADSINYVSLSKLGLDIHGDNGSGVSEQKVMVGYLDTNIYGAWLKDRVYIGGSAYSNAPIQIVGSSASISLGGLSANASSAGISGGGNAFTTANGLSTNYLSGNASTATMGITDSQVSANSSGAEIKQKIGVDATKAWSQYNNYYIQFGTGTTYGLEIKARFGWLAANVYGSWMTGGVYIGGATYDASEVRLTASTLEMGYISSNVYNMTLTSSVLSIGRTGSYYNTKIESGVISLGHLASGTSYALTMDYSGTEAARYFSIKSADLTEYFRIARYTIDSVYTNGVWAKKLLLMDSYSGDITSYSGYDGVNTRLYIVNPPAVGSAGCAAAIFSYYTEALECRTAYATAIYANAGSSGLTTHGVHGISFGGNGSTHPYENSAGVRGEGGSTSSVTGVYGSSYAGYGVKGTSQSGAGVYAYSASYYAIYAAGSGYFTSYIYSSSYIQAAGTLYAGQSAEITGNTITIYSWPVTSNRSNAAYSTAPNGLFLFESYVDSSNTIGWSSAIKGGKTNTTNADYKGYLILQTTYSSSYQIINRVLINHAGQMSIGNTTGAINITATTDIAATQSALVGASSESDSTITYTIYAKAYTSQTAIYGYAATGNGVYGEASSGYGVYGKAGASGRGVYGYASGAGSYGGVFEGATAIWSFGPVKMDNLATSGTAGTPIHIDGNGVLFKYTGSSERYKNNIHNRPYNKSILDLPVINFTWIDSGRSGFGTWAEKAHEIYPELVQYDKDGRPDTVKYCELPILLLQVCQEQQKEIDSLKQMINELKNKVDSLVKVE